jgi:hypothetical protein
MGGTGGFQSGATIQGGVGMQANDPYANVSLDLSKVKTATTKSADKKNEESLDKQTSKSNLKPSAKEDTTGKKGVQFGKATTYQLEVEATAADKE